MSQVMWCSRSTCLQPPQTACQMILTVADESPLLISDNRFSCEFRPQKNEPNEPQETSDEPLSCLDRIWCLRDVGIFIILERKDYCHKQIFYIWTLLIHETNEMRFSWHGMKVICWFYAMWMTWEFVCSLKNEEEVVWRTEAGWRFLFCIVLLHLHALWNIWIE